MSAEVTQTIGRPFNRDVMYSLSRDRAAVVAHEALASINNLRPEEQATAAALLFAVMASRFRLDPEDLHSFGLKLLEPQPFHRKGNALMEALVAYADMQKTGVVTL